MTPSWIGAGLGLIFGIAEFLLFSRVARGPVRQGPAAAMKIAAALSVVAFPVVGWFAGPLLADNFAVSP